MWPRRQWPRRCRYRPPDLPRRLIRVSSRSLSQNRITLHWVVPERGEPVYDPGSSFDAANSPSGLPRSALKQIIRDRLAQHGPAGPRDAAKPDELLGFLRSDVDGRREPDDRQRPGEYRSSVREA